MVATKAALSIRVDALTDTEGKSEPSAPTIGMENRAKLESRLRALEHQGDLAGIRSYANPSSSKIQKKFEMNPDAKTYNTAADAVDLVPTQREDGDLAPTERAVKAVLDVKAEKKRAKEERRRIKREAAAAAVPETNGTAMEVDDDAQDANGVEESEAARKERKRLKKEAKEAKKAAQAEANVGGHDQEQKKKRKRTEERTAEEPGEKKKKKKLKEE